MNGFNPDHARASEGRSGAPRSARHGSGHGIAIGPILFLITIMAVLAGVMANSIGNWGGTARIDAAETSLSSQANLIRTKITDCWTLSQSSALPDYPRTSGTIPAPQAALGTTACLIGSANSCYAVTSLACPSNGENIWQGTQAATLPPPPSGFLPWVYARDGNEIRISTRPRNPANTENQDVVRRARSRFSGPTVADTPPLPHHETDRVETGANAWTFTLWLKR